MIASVSSHILDEFRIPLSNPVLIFALILFIILLSPILLRKLKIPSIIGLIISGVIIGPHALNILEKTSGIELFSTIGLLYIMFIAGLDLDLSEFKKYKYRSITFGALTFFLPLAIGFPVCYYFLGYNFYASLLIASMFSTHTLVAYPIISKFGVSNNQAVAVVVGGTILTDTAVLLILAIIVNSSQGGLDIKFWIQLLVSLIVFLSIMFGAIPLITKWFFKKLESEKTSHYIFVLAVVFFSAFLSQLSGLEPIIGAFIAGLALNKLIPHSSALMNRIEFIGNSIFIPFFLISVGMIVDISVLTKGPTAIFVAVTLTVVALLGKWFAALFTQLIFKYKSSQRQLIFGLSSAHAAATLAVILVGYKAGILDENILNGTIILILFTCIIASFAAEMAAKKIVIDNESMKMPRSNDNDKTINEQILIPIANLQNMEKLLDFSILIKSRRSSNPITLLTVVPNNEEAEENLFRARRNLERTKKYASATETKLRVHATMDLNIASGIIRTTKELGADLIVIGWPKKSTIIELFIGKKTESILNETDKNVFICNLVKPLVAHDRVLIIAPPLSELEYGFTIWIQKITRLAQELSIPIFCTCNENTRRAIDLYTSTLKINHLFEYQLLAEWTNQQQITDKIQPNDFLVLVSARKGALSHLSMFDNIPLRLERNYKNITCVIVYPQRYESGNMYVEYEDVSPETVKKGIETVKKLRHFVRNIFKKN